MQARQSYEAPKRLPPLVAQSPTIDATCALGPTVVIPAPGLTFAPRGTRGKGARPPRGKRGEHLVRLATLSRTSKKSADAAIWWWPSEARLVRMPCFDLTPSRIIRIAWKNKLSVRAHPFKVNN